MPCAVYIQFIHELELNIYPGGHEIYDVGKPVFGNHYYVLSLPYNCSGVQMNSFSEIMCFTERI